MLDRDIKGGTCDSYVTTTNGRTFVHRERLSLSCSYATALMASNRKNGHFLQIGCIIDGKRQANGAMAQSQDSSGACLVRSYRQASLGEQHSRLMIRQPATSIISGPAHTLNTAPPLASIPWEVYELVPLISREISSFIGIIRSMYLWPQPVIIVI